MSKVVLLDTGVLGMVANPTPGAKTKRCQAWAADLLGKGLFIKVPDIADYESRREL